MTARSTAPIALLTAGGLVCLAATTIFVPTGETLNVPPVTKAGDAVTSTVTSTTDHAALAATIVLLVLAAAAFIAAGWLVVRRIRRGRAAQPRS